MFKSFEESTYSSSLFDKRAVFILISSTSHVFCCHLVKPFVPAQDGETLIWEKISRVRIRVVDCGRQHAQAPSLD